MKVFYIDHNDFATGLYRCVLPAYYINNYSPSDAICRGDLTTAGYGISEMSFALSDIIVFFRAFGPPELLYIDMLNAMQERHKEKVIIYDIDDFLHGIREANPASTVWTAESLELLDYAIRGCDALTTSTPRLAQYYNTKFGIRSYVCPNQIDHTSNRWVVSEREEKDYILIGWMGGSSHYEDLEILKDVIPKILSKYNNVKFKFMGMFPEYLEESERVIKQESWLDLLEYPIQKFLPDQLKPYPQEMSEFDIGLIPIADNRFNTIGKSDLKFLEYSMVSTPTIASGLHPYKDSIRHGDTGFLIDKNDTEGWVYYIEELILDEELRREMGKKAKQYILDERTYEKNIHKWLRAYESELILKRGDLVI